jgi:hypothetical protein
MSVMSLSTTLTDSLTDSIDFDLAVGLAEPCGAFAVDAESASPVCAHCGWLDHEHAAVARPRRATRVRVARRRGSLAAAS